MMNIPQVPKDITDAKQMQDYMTGIQKALTQKQIDDDKLVVNKTNITDSLDAKITAVGDGIIESGSNSNGSYIKFKDGTMIQFGLTTSYANTTLAATVYHGSITKYFPTPFITITSCVSQAATNSTNIVWGGISKVDSLERAIICKVGISSGDTGISSWLAIGTWK